MALVTASVWIADLMLSCSEGGVMPSVNRWLIAGRNLDWRECFLGLGLSAVRPTVGLAGWFGRLALAKYCEQSRLRLSATGSTSASACRCSWAALLWLPVATLKLLFCTTWSLLV